MSGTGILRREGAVASVVYNGPQDKHSARKTAFECNLALQLEKTLGGDASLSDVEAITKTLSFAYQKMTHAIDARTSLRFCINRYFVLQAGSAPTTGDYRLDAMDPFASKLLSYLPAKALDEMEPRIKAIGEALGKTEISRRHPTDWRLRINTPWVRLYLTFLSGRDKRAQSVNVTHNRRQPVNENIGLMILACIAAALSLLGAALITSTVWAFSELMMNPLGRDTLGALFSNTIGSLTGFLTSLGWLHSA